jgi:hypothetical protein
MKVGRRIKAWGMLAVGLALGLVIGGAVAAGLWIGKQGPQSVAAATLQDLKLKAVASHGTDTFAIATGAVDEDVEGLYTLDFLTGDLNCFVINPRTGAFGGWFHANVANVLKVERGKKPSYLIATGMINASAGGGGGRPAASLCYVADANTGQVAAFTFPWVKAATASGVAQATEMRAIGPWKARNIDLRQ